MFKSFPLLILNSTEEHQPMPLNVWIKSVVIEIKAPSGIKGFYSEECTVALGIGLASYCWAPLIAQATCRLLPSRRHLADAASCLSFSPFPSHPPTPVTRFRWPSEHQIPL